MINILRAILEERKKQTLFFITKSPIILHQEFFRKNHCVSFEILGCTTFTQKIKKILRAVLEKNCGLTINTNYWSDFIGPSPIKGWGSNIKKSHKVIHDESFLINLQNLPRLSKRWKNPHQYSCLQKLEVPNSISRFITDDKFAL